MVFTVEKYEIFEFSIMVVTSNIAHLAPEPRKLEVTG